MEKGKVPLVVPAPCYQLYAECIDDTLPKFTPENWIKKDRWYKVKQWTDALNTDGVAITITDSKNNEIHPSNSMSAFKSERFIIHTICLN